MNSRRPQRVKPLAPIGSLLKRITVAAPRRGLAEPEGGEVRYFQSIRECPCLHCGMTPCEPAHLRLSSAAYGKASGLGKKPEPKWVLPVCAEHHRLARDAQHNRNEAEFWDSLGINPLQAATLLWEARGDLVRMISVAHVIISERSIRKVSERRSAEHFHCSRESASE